ncbi:DUF413 domain-containing protein [bacterium endosymbiont of Pedicinus badii]|uniref:DUF413 domain-containing protein n=1 Tax=bacterium endosymbiont of Pedicinus badii TaxID=1719126 RepID=UPI0009BA7387|nr:DUF413 domain-containing protein [bacterium endosymbiont of Pedicinus badii]OQM34263.1 hypothetical protein AOQ89_01915 [bacterium endosymbiont of Pedicinus badii]
MKIIRKREKVQNSFITKKLYFDKKNYPYGFSRHGNFTIKEAKLLENFGHAYKELSQGIRIPKTEIEKQFIRMCNGKKKPSNKHEKVWHKYVEFVNKPKKFHTLSGGKPEIHCLEEYSENEE